MTSESDAIIIVSQYIIFVKILLQQCCNIVAVKNNSFLYLIF